MYIQDETIKTFVINAGLLGHADAQDAYDRATKKGLAFGEQLIIDGHLSDDDVRRVYSQALGMPFVDLRQTPLSFDALSLIPEPLARRYNIVAYSLTRKTEQDSRVIGVAGAPQESIHAEVAIMNNDAYDIIRNISQNLGITFHPRLTTADSIRYGLSQYQKKLKNNFGETIHTHVTSAVKSIRSKDAADTKQATELIDASTTVSVNAIMNTLIEHAITSHASDVHIEPRDSSLAIRYRLLGALHDAMILPLDIAPGLLESFKKISVGTASFYFDHKGTDVLIKVSYMPIYAGTKIVLTIIHKGIGSVSLEALGYDGYALEAVHKALHYRKGLIVQAGQPRAGVTTSMYSMLGTLNTSQTAIATIEEKIEQHLPFASQSILNSREGFTRVNALRGVLRQDPDVVMIDSIEETEVFDIALQAAARGLSVISSIRQKGTIAALEQLLANTQQKDTLVSQLSLITYQRLVKRLADSKEKYFLSEAGMKSLSKVVDMERVLTYMKDNHIVSTKATWKNIPLYRAIRSDNSSSGYTGAIGIFEVLLMNDGIRGAIKTGSTDAVIKEARNQGMLSVYEDGLVKAVQGLTTVDEVLRASV